MGDVLHELRQDPEVRLLGDLKADGERLWGCTAEDDADIGKFGPGICLNEDVAKALEKTEVRILVVLAISSG